MNVLDYRKKYSYEWAEYLVMANINHQIKWWTAKMRSISGNATWGPSLGKHGGDTEPFRGVDNGTSWALFLPACSCSLA